LKQAAARVWVRAEATGVIIVGRRKEVLDETVRSLESLNKGDTKILGIPADITVEEDVKNLFEQVNKAFGRPADVVIANAAVAADLAPVAETKASVWWNVFVSHFPSLLL
jgi:NAD(P)-dependent dehydrogenase (short-subunit alcohol dehydrogenase family)